MRAAPSTPVEVTVSGYATGLVGTLGVRVIDLAGGTVVARQTVGIVEEVAGSGSYAATLTVPASSGHYAILWDSGGALTPASVAVEDLFVSAAPVDGILVSPGAAFKTSYQAASGLAGSLRTRLVDNQGTTVIAATTGATEYPAGSGVYYRSISVPGSTPTGQYAALWDTGTPSPASTAGEDVWVVGSTVISSASSGERIPPTLFMCGREVVNPARALNYLKLYNPNGRFFDVDTTGLPAILYRLRGAAEAFATPVGDPAPWYDASIPSSGEFLGVVIDTLTGLDGRTTRTITQSADGSTLGRPYKEGVTLKAKGYLVAMTYAGLEYGKRWLIDQLNTTCQTCDVCDLQVRLCAPPDDGSNDELCHWTIPDAGLTEGPIYGNLPCPEIDTVTFTMRAESAWLFRAPVNCVPAELLWSDNIPGGSCVAFTDWFCGVGGPQHACTIVPPRVGVVGTIITIDATAGAVGQVRIGSYQTCPPAPGDVPDKSVLLRELIGGSKLVIDSSRKRITYTAPDGTISDGAPLIDPPDETLLPVWFEVDDCSPTTCISAQVEHQCGGGAFATVQIDTQLRAE